jgi:hypothetical protein
MPTPALIMVLKDRHKIASDSVRMCRPNNGKLLNCLSWS